MRKERKIKMKYNYYVCQYNNDDIILTLHQFNEDKVDEMMVEVSKFIAFSDCHDGVLVDIVMNNQHIHYDGWKPNMYMTYSNGAGEVVWEGSFPSWDH